MDHNGPPVLVVDDKPENLFVMEKILSDINCEVIKSNSGQKGLELCEQYDFACILLDVQMPEMNGFKFAKKLKEQKGDHETPPIIFVSAALQSEKYLIEGYASGAIDYLLKPINKDILLAKVGLFIRMFQQQESLNQTNKKLDELVHFDALTGLFNRRQFWRLMEEKLSYSKRYHTSIALLLFDLDDFKSMNDTFGHDFGDSLLVEFSNRLREKIRNTDVPFRLGGDEFALLIPNVDAADKLITFAQSLITRINDPFICEQQSIYPAVSIGIACNDNKRVDAKMLYKHADLALYHSKSSGKNIATIFDKAIQGEWDEETKLRDLVVREKLFTHEMVYKCIRNATNQDIIGVEVDCFSESQNKTKLNYKSYIEMLPDYLSRVEHSQNIIKLIGQQVNELTALSAGAMVAIEIDLSLVESNEFVDVLIQLRQTLKPSLKLSILFYGNVFTHYYQSTAKAFKKLVEHNILIGMDRILSSEISVKQLSEMPMTFLKTYAALLQECENKKVLLSLLKHMAKAIDAVILVEGDSLELYLEQNEAQAQVYQVATKAISKQALEQLLAI